MADSDVPRQKKDFLLMLLGVAILVIAGCFAVWTLFGKADQFPEVQLSEDERDALLARAKRMTIRPKDGVGPVRLGMTPKEAIAALGPPDLRLDDYQTTLHYRKLGLCLVFGMDDAELGAIVCMSDARETWYSRRDKPALTFAGSTEEGIHVGSAFADLEANFGSPDLSIKHANVYGPGMVSKHAFFGFQLWTIVKDGRVIEMSVSLPGWKKKPEPAK